MLDVQKGREALYSDCAHCSGLCCVGLYCAKSDGFPADKEAGKPCVHLGEDFRCAVHSALARRGLRGCMAYDCFGAGQRVTQRFGTWRENPAVFEAFHRTFRLHRLLWYLAEAAGCAGAPAGEAEALIAQGEQGSDLEAYQDRANDVLKAVIARTCTAGRPRSPDLVGRDLRRRRMEGMDLSMTLLIAANLFGCSLTGVSLLGADLRDADLRGADLRGSLFLSQGQVNSARGDGATGLPPFLTRPDIWC